MRAWLGLQPLAIVLLCPIAGCHYASQRPLNYDIHCKAASPGILLVKLTIGVDSWSTLQDIAASGIDFAIVRTGRTGIQEADFETSNNVAVGAQGSMPKQARITNNQVQRCSGTVKCLCHDTSTNTLSICAGILQYATASVQ